VSGGDIPRILPTPTIAGRLRAAPTNLNQE